MCLSFIIKVYLLCNTMCELNVLVQNYMKLLIVFVM